MTANGQGMIGIEKQSSPPLCSVPSSISKPLLLWQQQEKGVSLPLDDAMLRCDQRIVDPPVAIHPTADREGGSYIDDAIGAGKAIEKNKRRRK